MPTEQQNEKPARKVGARRRRKVNADDNLLDRLDVEANNLLAQAGLSVAGEKAIENGLALTPSARSAWHERNGTPFVEVDEAAVEKAKRYFEINQYVMDMIAPYLEIAGMALVDAARAGKPWAIKMMFEYIMGPPTQRTDVNVNTTSVSVVVDDRKRQAIALLERRMSDQLGIIEGGVVEYDDLESALPVPRLQN